MPVQDLRDLPSILKTVHKVNQLQLPAVIRKRCLQLFGNLPCLQRTDMDRIIIGRRRPAQSKTSTRREESSKRKKMQRIYRADRGGGLGWSKGADCVARSLGSGSQCNYARCCPVSKLSDILLI